MGKLKKIGIGIGVSLFFIFLIVPLVTITMPTIVKQQEVDQIAQISDQELRAMAVDWNYRDLLRNTDGYTDKIIFVDGTVSNIQRDNNSLTLCIDKDTFSCDNMMFVGVNENKWLEDDQLSGFVEVVELRERGTSNVFTGGEWVGSGEYIPRVNEIRLTCSNC